MGCIANCSKINISVVENLDKKGLCKERDSENCFMSFTLKENNGIDRYSATILKDRECPPHLPSKLTVVLGTLGGVLLPGLLLLIIWRIVTSIHDQRKYRIYESSEKAKRDKDSLVRLKMSTTTSVSNPYYTSE